MDLINLLWQRLLNTRRSFDGVLRDRGLLDQAFELGKSYHQDQLRESGEPYFTHPLEVAIILAEMGLDDETLAAALLHDVIEDVDGVTSENLCEKMGAKVVELVEGVTKIAESVESTDNGGMTKGAQNMATIRKILRSTQTEPRIILIKLADRLHNMRTLSSKSDVQKRYKKAKETLDIYVPIAARLGIAKFRRELGSLAVQHVYPDDFEKCFQIKLTYEKDRYAVLDQIDRQLVQNADGLVQQTWVHAPSDLTMVGIMRQKGIQDFSDNLGLRVIVDSEDACFLLLRRIHEIWPSRLGEVDYVTQPRADGYRAYHLRIVTEEGYLVMLQIMTESMRQRNDLGIAYDVRQGIDVQQVDFFGSIESVDDYALGSDEDFMHRAQREIFEPKLQVFVNGHTQLVPQGSTVLDAVIYGLDDQFLYLSSAYQGEIQLDYAQELKPGDHIQVKLGLKSQLDWTWAQMVQTTKGVRYVRRELKKFSVTETEATGRELIQRELDLMSRGFFDGFDEAQLQLIQTEFGIESESELFIAVALGKISAYQVMIVLYGNQSQYSWRERLLAPMIRWLRGGVGRLSRYRIQGEVREMDFVMQQLQSLRTENKVTYGYLNTWQHTHEEVFYCDVEMQADSIGPISKTLWGINRLYGVNWIRAKLSRLQKGCLSLFFLGSAFFAIGLPYLFYQYVSSEWTTQFVYTTFFLMFMAFVGQMFWHYMFALYIRHVLPQARGKGLLYGLMLGLNFAATVIFSWVAYDFGSRVGMEFSSLFPPVILILIVSLLFLPRLTQSVKSRVNMNNTSLSTAVGSKWFGYFLRGLAIIIYGTEVIVGKYFTDGLSGFELVTMAFSLAFILSFPFFIYSLWKDMPGIKAAYNKILVTLILSRMVLSLLIFSSLELTTATNTILFLNLAPVVAIIVSLLFFQNRFVYLRNPRFAFPIIGLFGLGTVGTFCLVVSNGLLLGQSSLMGDLLALAALVLDVIMTMAMIFYARYKSHLSGVILCVHMLFWIGLAALPFGIISFQNLELTPANYFAIGFIALFSYFIAYWLSFEAYRRVDGLISYLLFNVAPLITIVLEVVFFNLGVGWLLLLGAAFIILSSVGAELVNSMAEKQQKAS